MPKHSRKRRPRKRSLSLPDLEQTKSAVLNSLTSKSGQRTYDHAINEFVDWYCSEPRLAFNRTVVLRYRIHLQTSQAGYTYRPGAGASVELAATEGWSRTVNVDSPVDRLGGEFRKGETLYEEHRGAATRALPCSPATRFGLVGIGTTGRGHSQELVAQRQHGLAAAIGQEAEEADAYNPCGSTL